MSDSNVPEPYVESVAKSATEKYYSPLVSTPDSETTKVDGSVGTQAKTRLFNRERSIHSILGGGKSADVLLWKEKLISAGVLGGSTIVWLLFEKFGYTLITVISYTLLVLTVGLFIWSNVAMLLKRQPPPLPKLELSEKMVSSYALALREQINKVSSLAHKAALGKDYRLFFRVVAILWGLSLVGGWFHLLTIVYLLIIIAHSVPIIYNSYEDHIDAYAKIALDEAHKHYRKIDVIVSKNIKTGFKKVQ